MAMGKSEPTCLPTAAFSYGLGGDGSAVKSVYRYCRGPETTYSCLQLHLHETQPSTAHTWGVRLKDPRASGLPVLKPGAKAQSMSLWL